MQRKALFALIALASLTACETTRNRTGYVGNPQTDWSTSGSDGAGGLPARDQTYTPGSGSTSYPDNGQPHEGRTTGTVFFGALQTGGGYGAANSTASTEFLCGEAKGQCVVEVSVGANSSAGFASDEYLVLTLQHLDDQGQPVGAPATSSHRASDQSRVHKLKLPDCGRTRLTISFRETVTPSNPAGIQTKFSAKIDGYACYSS